MRAVETVTPSELTEYLLQVATLRPVHLWGQPGIGKSSLVTAFAEQVGLPVVTLLGTQLAGEDISGVPELVEGPDGPDGPRRSRFAPPADIARADPYVLFLDELNGSSPEVQKAFYSLVLDRRVGTWTLHPESIVIAAGNRATDAAIVRPMSSALVNRFVHFHLEVSAHDWLAWAVAEGVHPWVVDYVAARHDHLVSAPPKTEEPFSTPRSWHTLSDMLNGWSGPLTEKVVRTLAFGCLTPAHAAAFTAYTKTRAAEWDLEAIVKGDLRWPAAPSDRDVLHFLTQSFRSRLVKDVPADRSALTPTSQQFVARGKALLVELAEISVELAQVAVAGDEDGNPVLPAWFLAEVMRDLPRLVAART